MRLDPIHIKHQIGNLRVSYPELVEDDDAWLLAIESETDLDKMLTAIVRQIEDTKALLDGTAERLADLQARKLRFARRVESLRTLAFKMLDAAGMKKLELPEATLSVRAGQPRLIGDNANLPDELCIISREPDRTKIKDALKAGQEVPGFSMSNAEPSISIRIK
jgi:hypothetical protein